MFSGIVQAIGRIGALERRGGDARVDVEAAALGLDDVSIGDSIAVAGVCLTVVARDGARFSADLSAETLARTTLGAYGVGDPVNLEKSLRLADRLGGHLVAGHIDGGGRIERVHDDGAAQRWIAIDGVSLTVNDVDGDTFGVTLIPHTLAVTTFGVRRPGDPVNLEVDLVARYVERLMNSGAS